MIDVANGPLELLQNTMKRDSECMVQSLVFLLDFTSIAFQRVFVFGNVVSKCFSKTFKLDPDW